ncbi:MAG: HAD-IA family hydrolase [Alphaproteobacteria bacterium]
MKLVIFDIDGTLVDSRATILRQWRAMFVEHGMAAPDDRTILSVIGMSLEPAITRLMGEGSREDVLAMAKSYRDMVLAERADGVTHDALYPGARDVVDRLGGRDEVLMGIATGKAMRGIHHMLDVHDLEGQFQTLQAADVAPSKPNPGMVLQAMGETGVDAANTFMIGDTEFDMQMARNAGAQAIGVSWGYHDVDHLVANGAQRIIDHFDELIPVLDKIW